MAGIGLVLGAGGMVGQAYHAGVLAALAERTDWDPRDADVIVGTSAGSVTGAVLRLGGSAPDLAAYMADEPVSPEGRVLFRSFGDRRRDLPPFTLAAMLRGWRPPSGRAALAALRRPWAIRPMLAAATLLPPGRIDITEHTSLLDRPDGGRWPEGFLACAVRRADGRRVVLGRPGSPTPSLGRGVAASCAIPGYFAPVPVAGEQLVDGGAHSPTNADVLLPHRPDLVVAIAPLSAHGGRARTPDGIVRLAAHRTLHRELSRLRQAGAKVLCFEPEPDTLAVMGVNAMAEDRAPEVVAAARAEAQRRLEDPRLAIRLDRLSGRRLVTRVA